MPRKTAPNPPKYIKPRKIAKGAYSEYLKRDDQLLAFRLPEEERRDRMVASALNQQRDFAHVNDGDGYQGNGKGRLDEDVVMPDFSNTYVDDFSGAKVIVIHPGSQNLRIGLATDALAKTVPMVIARKWEYNESENLEPKPKRFKADDGSELEPEKMFGQDVIAKIHLM